MLPLPGTRLGGFELLQLQQGYGTRNAEPYDLRCIHTVPQEALEIS